jgi:adenine phosphoribosyltransferase
MDIKPYINIVYDFLVKGSNALDMSSLMSSPEVFNYCIDWYIELATANKIDHIVAIETRGFVWASAVAYKTKLPLHLARKPFVLPGGNYNKKFSSRGRPYSLSMMKSSRIIGKVMVIDDTLVSGATFDAVGDMLTEHWDILPNNQYHAALIYSKSFPGQQFLIDKGYNVDYLASI